MELNARRGNMAVAHWVDPNGKNETDCEPANILRRRAGNLLKWALLIADEFVTVGLFVVLPAE